MAKKKTRRNADDGALSITSMMDMMTIILVFLLKSYSTQDITVKPSDDLQLPTSDAMKPPKLAVNVIIKKNGILVDGVPTVVLTMAQHEETGEDYIDIREEDVKGQLVSPLYDRLVDKAEQAKSLGERMGGGDFDFKGEILLQVDKEMPFSVVRRVMYTAGQAQFSNFRFVVIKARE